MRLLTLLPLLFLLSSCSLFKLLNSAAVALKYNETRATMYGVDYESKKALSDGSISVRNVQHPKVYGNWNINLKIRPSIHADKNTLIPRENLTPPASLGLDKYPDIKYKRVSAMGNLKLTMHTPIGAFAGAGGAGISAFEAKSPGVINTLRTRYIRKLDFTWTGFFSKRFYILTGPRYYYDGNWQFVYAFRIGFYWGSTNQR